MLIVTPIYAAALALVFVWLSVRVISARGKHNVWIGTGDDAHVHRLVRAQANCAEYGPIAILLILMMELQDVANWGLHLAGATLLVGRVLHGIALAWDVKRSLTRAAGMILTLLVLIGSALTLLATALL